jgi:hypothetical protein
MARASRLMVGAAVMVWVPMRTVTVRSGLSVRTSF